MAIQRQLSEQLKEELAKETKMHDTRAERRRFLIQKLHAKKIKCSNEAILMIDEDKEENIVFLERGNAKAGYKHIVERHANDFKRKGISTARLPFVLFSALKAKTIVGEQGNKKNRKTARPVYHEPGTKTDIAICTGDNGFIVGANPCSSKK